MLIIDSELRVIFKSSWLLAPEMYSLLRWGLNNESHVCRSLFFGGGGSWLLLSSFSSSVFIVIMVMCNPGVIRNLWTLGVGVIFIYLFSVFYLPWGSLYNSVGT